MAKWLENTKGQRLGKELSPRVKTSNVGLSLPSKDLIAIDPTKHE